MPDGCDVLEAPIDQTDDAKALIHCMGNVTAFGRAAAGQPILRTGRGLPRLRTGTNSVPERLGPANRIFIAAPIAASMALSARPPKRCLRDASRAFQLIDQYAADRHAVVLAAKRHGNDAANAALAQRFEIGFEAGAQTQVRARRTANDRQVRA